ncbi:MAG: hypothetical protein HY910_16495 [Desulfarculus sp.]|nr:hypothetical protein [Desulfarculus sp.]
MTQAAVDSAIQQIKKSWLDELRNFVAGMGTDDPDAVVSACFISHLLDLKPFPDGEFKPYAMARMRNKVIFTRLLVLEEWQYNKSAYLSQPDKSSNCYNAGRVFFDLDPDGICLTALCFTYGPRRLNEQELTIAQKTWGQIRERILSWGKAVPSEQEIIKRGRERGLILPHPTLATAA